MNLSQVGAGIEIAKEAAPKLAKLKGVANNIEAVFLKQLISEMRKGVKKVSLGQSYGGDMFQDMMDQQLADSASKSGNFGIGKIIYQQFSKDVLRQAAGHVKLAAIAAEAKLSTESGTAHADPKGEAIASKEQS